MNWFSDLISVLTRIFHRQAAGLLKRAEGIVTLTLCNPNKKEDGGKDDVASKTGADAAAPAAAKKVEPPPEPEVPKDPATCAIDVNKETTIELNAEKKPLGIMVVKGDCSEVQVYDLVISLDIVFKIIIVIRWAPQLFLFTIMELSTKIIGLRCLIKSLR